MSKKENTKYLIAESIMNLMLTKSIDHITILEIARNCGVSKQTFYNHFTDKYALVDWIYKTEAVNYITLVGEGCTWYDAVISKLNIIKRNPSFYKKVYRQEWFLNSFFNITKQLYIDVIKKKMSGEITPHMQFLVEFYCYACVKETSCWVLSGFQKTPEELVESFLACIPDEMKEYLI